MDNVLRIVGLVFRPFLKRCSDIPAHLSQKINKWLGELRIGQELHAAMLSLSKNCSN